MAHIHETNSASDLPLVQTHLNILQGTRRPAPSLHHTLANRLETWLQNMNTPPAIDPDVAQMEFDPSWAIFDENSNRLASETFFQQLDVNQNINLEAENLDSMANNAVSVHDPRNFQNGKGWNSHDNVIDAWPSNLLRLFGTADYQSSSNGVVNLP